MATYITVAEATELMGLGPQMVRQLFRDGKLKGYASVEKIDGGKRRLYISLDSVNEWLQKRADKQPSVSHNRPPTYMDSRSRLRWQIEYWEGKLRHHTEMVSSGYKYMLGDEVEYVSRMRRTITRLREELKRLNG